MAQQPDPFRDFGILPQGVQPPPECVRCLLSRGRVIGQYIGTGIVSALGLVLAVLLGVFIPFPLNLLGAAAALAGFGSVVYLATHNDYRWVELDGKTVRAKHLYTGRVIERSIDEIQCLATIVYQVLSKETVVIEALLGRVKGIEIRFRDLRTPLRILRADPAMTNAKELIEAVIFRMAQLREVDADVVNLEGTPLVRYIHWKGEKPVVQSGKAVKVVLCVFVFLALMFASILAFLGRQEHRVHVLASVPPQELPLQTLIENGPGTNPHVALTDFRFGGYMVETKSGSISNVLIALYPTSKADRLRKEPPDEPKEIKAVLACKTIRNDAALAQFLRQGRVKGLCSETPGLTYGSYRTKLAEANPGSSLSSAWVIDELSEPPSGAIVLGIFLGSGACFAVVIGLALVILLKT